MNPTTIKPTDEQWSELESEVTILLRNLLSTIDDDCRCSDDPDDETPGICVTVGATIRDDGSISWSYQTGDNSFTGGAYGHPIWGVGYLCRDSDLEDVARGIVSEIADQTIY